MHRKLAVLPGNSSAKAAIDMAFHDLAAKAADLPVIDLLGGACRDSVMTTFPIGICAPDEARKLAQDSMSRNMGAIKMKIGRGPAKDVVRIRAVRDEVGPDILLLVDAAVGIRCPRSCNWPPGSEASVSMRHGNVAKQCKCAYAKDWTATVSVCL